MTEQELQIELSWAQHEATRIKQQLEDCRYYLTKTACSLHNMQNQIRNLAENDTYPPDVRADLYRLLD